MPPAITPFTAQTGILRNKFQVMLATMLAVIMLCVNGCGNAEPSEGLESKLNPDGECRLYGTSLC